MAVSDHPGFCPVHSEAVGPASTLPAGERLGERDSSRSVIAPGVMRRGGVEVCGLPRTLA
jgi:hypothetical protein